MPLSGTICFHTKTSRRLSRRQTVSLVNAIGTASPNSKDSGVKLATVEQVIENIMKAIRQGILTTTKEELEKAEAERARLQAAIKAHTSKADKVATFLREPKNASRRSC